MKGGGDRFSEDGDLTPPVHPVQGQMGDKRPCLIVIAGAQVGEIFRVDHELVIGRDEQATLRVVDDRGVSRRHAKVVAHGDQASIADLGSANGTYVDGERIRAEQPLTDGAKIRVGQFTVLRYSRYDHAEEQAQRQLLEEALRDGLTHAFNRRYFMQRLRGEVRYAGRHHQPLCLLMLDLDDFKRVNDRHGHPFGDRVLQRIAEQVTHMLRVEDVFARYGGEEFVILLRNVPLDDGTKVAERARELVTRADLTARDGPVAVTISVGVAALALAEAEREDAAERLIEHADAALYRAKRAGKNRVST